MKSKDFNNIKRYILPKDLWVEKSQLDLEILIHLPYIYNIDPSYYPLLHRSLTNN